MYQSHFGLQQSPFGITPNPAFFYSGNTRGEILQALLYVVIHGEGIIKVTGEVGSGKTMLCRMLENQLPPHIEVIYLVNPSLSPLEVLFAIAGELGLRPDGKRGDEVLRQLHTDLIAKHSAGKQVVLLVEEAQAMPLDTLEEIRLLTNLETARNKLLQIVLFGQPELDEHLDLASMRQLKERITHSFEVPAMAPELVPDFLAFRLRAAGYQGPALFSPQAARRIARVSQGIVRRINILADKALLAAFAADAPQVNLRHVDDAIQDSQFKQKINVITSLTAALSLLIVLLLAGIVWLLARPPLAAPPLWPAPGGGPAPLSAAPGRLPLLATANAAAVSNVPGPGLLAMSLRASRAWLRDEPEHHWSLQIVSLPAAETGQLEQFLRATQAAIGLEQVHAYPQRVQGMARVALVYGSFSTREQAATVQALLAQRWAFRPQIRDIAAMRTEAAEAGFGPLR